MKYKKQRILLIGQAGIKDCLEFVNKKLHFYCRSPNQLQLACHISIVTTKCEWLSSAEYAQHSR